MPRNQPHHNPSISPNKCSNRRQRGREAWQDRQKSFHMHRSPDLRMTQGGLSLLVLLPHLLLLSPDAKSKVRFHHNQECSIETFLKSPDKSKYKCRIGFYLLDFCSSQILSFIICPGPGKLPISWDISSRSGLSFLFAVFNGILNEAFAGPTVFISQIVQQIAFIFCVLRRHT